MMWSVKYPSRAKENRKRCASIDDIIKNPVKIYITESDNWMVGLLSNNLLTIKKTLSVHCPFMITYTTIRNTTKKCHCGQKYVIDNE